MKVPILPCSSQLVTSDPKHQRSVSLAARTVYLQKRVTRRASRRGIALVMVLISLTLLSILILAFLSSASTDLDSSSSFAASADAKQRSQTAVNLVIGQIQEATSKTDLAWSSQPGMIRTFNTDGSAAEQFKLYSSANMLQKSFNPTSAGNPTDIPTDWDARPAEYVDLNQPVLVQDNANGAVIPDAARPSDKYVAQYPILDPSALGIVKGFSIDVNGDGISESAPVDSFNPITSGNPAPMPVQWMYMLQDGSLRTLDAASKSFNGSAVTADNPVVARIAFWTDDETCKVNINTAAGDEWDNVTDLGSFNDMPFSNNTNESILKGNQPVNKEYQRYAGHPATTYLSAVFPDLTRSEIYDIVPRISWDTKYSAGGTKETWDYAADSATAAKKYAGLPLSDGMPLYASVDELRYVRSTTARTVTSDTVLTAKQIDYSKFFLTATSRAPEVNLFNKPRVTMWPEAALLSNRSLFDRSIAFCSTIAGNAYYFVRNDSTNATTDYTAYPRNQELYAYLQDLTSQAIPGFGGNFLTKYGTDRDQILTEIFDYIRCLNLADPDATTGFATNGLPSNNLKASTIRSTSPGIGHVVPIEIGDTRGFGRTYTIYNPIIMFSALASAVDPADAALDTRGSISGGVWSGPDGFLRGKLKEKADKARIYTTKVQAVVFFEMFSPSCGVMRFMPNLVIRVKGLNNLSFDGKNLGFTSDAQVDFNGYTPNHEYAWGSISTCSNLFWNKTTQHKAYPFFSGTIDVNKQFRAPTEFSGSDKVVVEIYSRDNAGTISSTPIQTIKLNFPTAQVPMPMVPGMFKATYNSDSAYAYDDSPTVRLSGTQVDLKTRYDSSASASDSGVAVMNNYYNGGAVGGQQIFDATRSLVSATGDHRLICATKNVDLTAFVPARGYNTTVTTDMNKLYYIGSGEDSTGGMVACGPRSSNGGSWCGTSGKLVKEVTYNQHIGSAYDNNLDSGDFGPAVPSNCAAAEITLSNGTKIPGDWDTGMGSVFDGPYINKADEGERGNTATAAYGGYGGSAPLVSMATLFSPNRQAPSPVIFGSLSTGVKANKPWQTLLFCPNPAGKSLHPGAETPPDHLLLDFFSMPVVEPYAISEPFSTSGKVNINYQIVPFTYITRSTALQAVLRSTRLTAIPTVDGRKYKSSSTSKGPNLGPTTGKYRLNIDLDETMKGFQSRFDNNEIFKSASQICEMFLVPSGVGATINNVATWWDTYRLTGDNLRERPYANIYGRLTTKSNTYTVYLRVQSLQKAKTPNADYNTWVEGTDKVISEYRGSCTIERFLNPNLTAAQYNPADPLTAYKFRTLSTKQFAP
ncbi:MAG: Verru_Chthon cassette protein A [Candidatus Methylacidiphilales bacterium]|nr:Verru_Chthon cassette protein A [Candidatus Methylacidiphilales bacterium]